MKAPYQICDTELTAQPTIAITRRFEDGSSLAVCWCYDMETAQTITDLLNHAAPKAQWLQDTRHDPD